MIVLNPFLDFLCNSAFKNIGLTPGNPKGCFQHPQDVFVQNSWTRKCKNRFTKLCKSVLYCKSVLFTRQLERLSILPVYLPSTFLTIRASLQFFCLWLDTDDWTILLCKLGVIIACLGKEKPRPKQQPTLLKVS